MIDLQTIALSVFRKMYLPISNWWIEISNKKKEDSKIQEAKKIWNDNKIKPPKEFSAFLRSYRYQKDSSYKITFTSFDLNVDNTVRNPESFILNEDANRDCDDFAEMWKWYMEAHPELFSSYFTILTCDSKNPSQTMHMTSVGKLKNKKYFILCDYEWDENLLGDNIDSCMNYIAQKYKYEGHANWSVYSYGDC